MFNAIADKVIVKPLDGNDMTDGGVILPDIAQEDTDRGVVVSVGPGVPLLDGKLSPMQTKPGDVVVYPKFGVKKLDHNGEQYVITKEAELLTILTEESIDEK